MKLIMSDREISFTQEDFKDIKYINLAKLKIANCVGCFGCWTRTPGKCVIRDDATQVYPYIAKCDKVIYITHVKYGGYDTLMKTMLERAIPTQQAFIRIHNGETHHVQRDVAGKDAVIIAYGATSQEEKDIFTRLVSRNAHNMMFEKYRIVFTTEAMTDNVVKNYLEEWKE